MKRNTLMTILSCILGVLLLGVWFTFVDVDKVASYLSAVHVGWLVIAMLLYVLGNFIRSARWNFVIKPVVKLGYWKTFVLFMSGNFINFLIPIRAGELAKSYFLKKTHNIPMSVSFPTIVFDKLLDLLPIFMVLVLAPFVGIGLGSTIWTVIIILAVISAICFVLYWIGLKKQVVLVNLFKGFLFWLPSSFKPRAFTFVENGVKGFSVARRHYSHLLVLLFLTSIGSVIDTLYLSSVFKAFDVAVPLIIVFIGYTIFNLSYVLPTPPAQLGSVEVILLLIFSGAFGIDKDIMNSVIIVVHAMTGVYIVAAGLISSIALGINIKETMHDASSGEG